MGEAEGEEEGESSGDCARCCVSTVSVPDADDGMVMQQAELR